MNTQVSSWLATANETKDALKKAINGFQSLSNSYEDIRNIGYKNNEKEAIDMHYSDVTDLRSELCNIQAGGRRKKTRRLQKKRKAKASTRRH